MKHPAQSPAVLNSHSHYISIYVGGDSPTLRNFSHQLLLLKLQDVTETSFLPGSPMQSLCKDASVELKASVDFGPHCWVLDTHLARWRSTEVSRVACYHPIKPRRR